MVSHAKREENAQRWFARIKDWEESGLSLIHYCNQHQINKSTLYYWRSLLKKKPCSPPSKFIPIRTASITKESRGAPEYIQLKLLTGLVLQLPLSMNMENIAQLIHAVGKLHD